MKYESIGNVTLPKIGFGTWRIGGGSSPNRSLDKQSLNALRSALEMGYSHIDTAEMYASGHTEELVGQAIRESGIPRGDLFITSKVIPEHLHYKDVLKSCEGSLRRLDSEYLDLYLIHWPNAGMDLADTFRALNKLVKDDKVRHLGVSNFNLKLLERSLALTESHLLTDQVPYSLFDRTYAKNGVLEYCQRNGILLTAYTPLNEGNVKGDKTLRSIAGLHSVTTYQVALAWLASQSRVITIPMSFDRQHQKENLEAADLKLTPAEINQLDGLG
jgi:diketogulonate reductase-like aldo/keto reductase